MIEPRLRRLQWRMAAKIAWDTVLIVTFLAQSSPRLTLLVKSRWPTSNAKGVRVTRDMGSVSLAFERCVSAHFSACF
jgi:hypothetical protein